MDLFSLLLFAKITAASAHGFISEHQIDLPEITPHEAYQALTRDVSLWWDASHSYSGEARNFSIDARAGGCFCEQMPAGGSVEHMRVVYAEPGKLLRMSGGLGPLQAEAVRGSMSFAFEAWEGGTRLNYRYAVSGYLPGGVNTWAEAVDQVQLGQLERLRTFLAAE